MWKVSSYLYHHLIKNLPVVNPFPLLELPTPIFLNNAQKYSINCKIEPFLSLIVKMHTIT